MSTNLMPINALTQDLQWVYGVPVLTAEEESELAYRLRDEEDLEAAHELVLSHMRYVVRIAKSYQGYGLPFVDLVQEGAIGLMKAVKRFDPDKGFRLVTFAVHWIRSEIHEYIIRNWRLVKVATTKAQRKLFFNLRQKRSHLGWLSQQEAQDIAEDLGVKITDVREMESRLSAHDLSLDAPKEDESGPRTQVVPALPAPDLDPVDALIQDEQADRKERVLDAMQSLNAREQDILRSRWLAEEKTSLKSLAERYSVSIERIRQIEKAAIERLSSL